MLYSSYGKSQANSANEVSNVGLGHYDDQKLATLLSRNAAIDYNEHVALEVMQLETRFRSLDAGVFHTPAITSAFERLKAQSKRLQPVDLVPIHADPNTKNMLLTGSKRPRELY